ncbi:hypothetical protein CUN67_20965 (plasmid) [Pantoea cypripedii]|uniref:Uncharacterized protein n=1 Tax=Pantoea cypripedii TaxID=55209 RepID=A0A6B9GEQ9_PANCY|nr:hypothetical protein CUN67_20965 [Pantoea cypripedii]
MDLITPTTTNSVTEVADRPVVLIRAAAMPVLEMRVTEVMAIGHITQANPKWSWSMVNNAFK